MAFITLDFETYYSNEVGFKKQTNEEYLRDAEFEVIGVSVKVDDAAAVWFSGDKAATKNFLDQYDWHESALLCHNMMFDGAILAWHYGIIPAMYYDTLCMARAVHGVDAGGSLAKLVERYNLGVKGTEVVNALDKKRLDFDEASLARYGAYCINDTELTYKLFNILAETMNSDELDLIDLTLRMYTQPSLKVDDALLIERLDEVKQEKSDLLRSLMSRMSCATEEEVRKKLASNKQFAAVLEEAGAVVPMKTSPATGKQTFALAKNDEGFIALTEDDDSYIQQLCAVRLGTKSTIEESRIERFIHIGARNKGMLPIPLKYYGAHTGRWSGMDMVNFQNLPSRDKKKKTLKNSIVAPRGHIIINCDSSQIEARVLAWLAGQDDVTEQFANGEDVYSAFASKIYKKPISKENPVERFVGKTCVLGLGYGTGAAKLKHTLKTQPPNADLDEEECKKIVELYRQVNDKITKFWRSCDLALGHMMMWPVDDEDCPHSPYYLDINKTIKVSPVGVQLPNGLYIRYPNLQRVNNKVMYESRKGKVNIWGGTMVENVVQALARVIVGEQMLSINVRYRPVLTVHDAAVIVVPENELRHALAFITKVMSTPPTWAVGLPVACEAKYGISYGDC